MVYAAGYLGQVPGFYGYGDFYFGPSVDGEIVRDLPSNEFKQGHFTKVALLTDRDGYEGYVFSNASETTMAEETADLEQVFPYAKQSFFNRLYEYYPASNFNSTLFQRAQLFGDFIIECPTYYMASAVSDWGLPTYKLVRSPVIPVYHTATICATQCSANPLIQIFDAGTELHAATGPFLFTTNSSGMSAIGPTVVPHPIL